MTYANGDVYDGTWENDCRHGHGSMIYKDTPIGVRFIGNWVNDSMDGVSAFLFLPFFGYVYYNHCRMGMPACIRARNA